MANGSDKIFRSNVQYLGIKNLSVHELDMLKVVLVGSEFEKIQYLHIDMDGNDYWILKELEIP